MSESHLAALTVMSVVLPAKGDVFVVQRQQSVVGDGHAMRVAGQILQDMFRPSERCLGVDDPILPEESAEECGECFFVCQLPALSVENELFPVKRLFQASYELPAKNAAEHPHGQEEVGW